MAFCSSADATAVPQGRVLEAEWRQVVYLHLGLGSCSTTGEGRGGALLTGDYSFICSKAKAAAVPRGRGKGWVLTGN